MLTLHGLASLCPAQNIAVNFVSRILTVLFTPSPPISTRFVNFQCDFIIQNTNCFCSGDLSTLIVQLSGSEIGRISPMRLTSHPFSFALNMAMKVSYSPFAILTYPSRKPRHRHWLSQLAPGFGSPFPVVKVMVRSSRVWRWRFPEVHPPSPFSFSNSQETDSDNFFDSSASI